VVLKVNRIAPLRAILRGKEAKRPKREIGWQNKHKWGENAQPLIDH